MYNSLEGGNVVVYTGPKGGKYIIRYGNKVYLDKKSLASSVRQVVRANSKKSKK